MSKRTLWVISAVFAILAIAVQIWDSLGGSQFNWRILLMMVGFLMLAITNLMETQQSLIYRILSGIAYGLIILGFILIFVIR